MLHSYQNILVDNWLENNVIVLYVMLLFITLISANGVFLYRNLRDKTDATKSEITLV